METTIPVPIGFRFRPTHEELINYLLRKIVGKPIPCMQIEEEERDRDLYGNKPPWEMCRDRKRKSFYCFAHLKKASSGSKRASRTTTWGGVWQGSTVRKPIYHVTTGKLIGEMRQFFFKVKKKGKDSGGTSSSSASAAATADHNGGNWLMNEYSIIDDNSLIHGINCIDCVLCYVFKNDKKCTKLNELEEEEVGLAYEFQALEEEFCNPMGLPLGYRFLPTDEELIRHYLVSKIVGNPLPWNGIAECSELYGHSPPWEICSEMQTQGLFAFTELKKASDKRTSRTTSWGGVWHGSTRPASVCDAATGEVIGRKRQFVFRLNKGKGAGCSSGSTTDGKTKNWLMNEYSLIDESTNYVLCHLYKNDPAETKSLKRKRESEEAEEGGVATVLDELACEKVVEDCDVAMRACEKVVEDCDVAMRTREYVSLNDPESGLTVGSHLSKRMRIGPDSSIPQETEVTESYCNGTDDLSFQQFLQTIIEEPHPAALLGTSSADGASSIMKTMVWEQAGDVRINGNLAGDGYCDDDGSFNTDGLDDLVLDLPMLLDDSEDTDFRGVTVEKENSSTSSNVVKVRTLASSAEPSLTNQVLGPSTETQEGPNDWGDWSNMDSWWIPILKGCSETLCV